MRDGRGAMFALKTCQCSHAALSVLQFHAQRCCRASHYITSHRMCLFQGVHFWEFIIYHFTGRKARVQSIRAPILLCSMDNFGLLFIWYFKTFLLIGMPHLSSLACEFNPLPFPKASEFPPPPLLGPRAGRSFGAGRPPGME